MPEFAYQGRNARGELVKGMLEGASSSAVADQLFSTGITPVHINEAKAAAAVAVGKLGFGEPKVELADLMLLSRQMHILLKAGVPIRSRVMSGSWAWKLENILPNAGTTKILTMNIATASAMITMVG